MYTLQEISTVLDSVLKNLSTATIEMSELYVPIQKENFDSFTKFRYGDIAKVVVYKSQLYKDSDSHINLSITLSEVNYEKLITVVITDSLDNGVYLTYDLETKYKFSNDLRNLFNVHIFKGKPSKDELFNLSMNYDYIHELFEIFEICMNNIDKFKKELQEI